MRETYPAESVVIVSLQVQGIGSQFYFDSFMLGI
jgi:hypothetical protein